MRKFIVCMFFSLCCMINIAFAYSMPKEVRIGLSYGSNALSSFTLTAPSGIKVDGVGKLTGEVTFSKSGNNKLAVSSSSKTKTCTVDEDDGVLVTPVDDDEFISFNGKEYRGNFVIYRFSDSDITVINVLGIEEYLYGVVPREIATGHPIEALKAQAVAARTYTCKTLGKYEKWKFDMTNTTADQSYGGVSAECEDTTKAVDATKRRIVTYNGEPITTYYFSTSGGWTENSENVWVTAYPYLVAVEDKYQPDNLTYSNWSVTFTANKLKEILDKKSIKIGDIIGLNTNKKSDSNGVLELEFVGTKDSYSVTKETTRSIFGTSEVRSQFYDVIPDNAVTAYNLAEETDTKSIVEFKVATSNGAKKISSNLDEVTVIGKDGVKTYSRIPTEYTISGKGWGHGVGMSQNGAIGMAKAGFDYEEILTWYYTGTKITKAKK